MAGDTHALAVERMFPVLYGWSKEEYARKSLGPREVPWALLAPHEAQARRNHGQTLERLAERGGLGLCEMVAIIEDRECQRMDQEEARTRILAACAALRVGEDGGR